MHCKAKPWGLLSKLQKTGNPNLQLLHINVWINIDLLIFNTTVWTVKITIYIRTVRHQYKCVDFYGTCIQYYYTYVVCQYTCMDLCGKCVSSCLNMPWNLCGSVLMGFKICVKLCQSFFLANALKLSQPVSSCPQTCASKAPTTYVQAQGSNSP